MNKLATGVIVFVAVVGGLLAAIYVGVTRWGREQTNPYPYDISSFTKTDTALVYYVEGSPLSLRDPSPVAIAIGTDDCVYVAGTLVEVVSPARQSVRTFALPAAATALAIAPDARLYVGMLDRIAVLDATGGVQQAWPSLGTNAIITAIAMNGSDVFAADAGQHVVWRLDATGGVTAAIGRKDVAKGIRGFVIPSAYFDLAIGLDHSLWVVNPGLHQFENYSRDGELRTSWRRASLDVTGFCGCCNPSHFALMRDGSFVTSEKSIPRVKVHDPSGDFVSLVAGPDSFDADATGLDVALDAQQRVLVLDPKRRTLRTFTHKE